MREVPPQPHVVSDLYHKADLPAGDINKPWWTYEDLAVAFGRSVDSLKRRDMPQWESQDFPAPLPWSMREKRWNPRAVLGWKRRRETATRASPVELLAIDGGRS